MAVWILIFGVGWTGLILADFFGQNNDFDVPTWVYAIAAVVTIGLLCFFYAGAAATFDMLEYRFDDLGLHIRKGVGTVQEITLSYRNIQNVAIQRGPIDLWLGMAKLVVETAGGGGAIVAGGQGAGHEASMAVMGHRGMMVGIDRFVAEDVRRDLIERMNRFHGAGLGDSNERRRESARSAAGGAAAAGLGRLVITSEQLELVRETIANIRRATEALAGPTAPYAGAGGAVAFAPGRFPSGDSGGDPAADFDPPLPPQLDLFQDSTPRIDPGDRPGH
jgi:membrane protein YdbS with pleckstrin-like domain